MNTARLGSVLLATAALLAFVLPERSPFSSVDAQSPPPDVILLASTARLVGAWRIAAVDGAAGGTATVLPNAGRAKVITPLANPVDYFELTFSVTANTPYRFWVRGRATADYRLNDSVHVQFTNSLDPSGSPMWRIGSTTSMEMNLEDCSGCGNSGWGWEDNGWGSVGAPGPEVRFATSGQQTLRVQNREDGFYIDQLVLSPSTYLTSAPGANKNDDTILIGGDPPPTGSSEIVLHAASGRAAGAWQIVNEASAASGRAAVLPDAGRPRVNTPLAAPADYVEATFQALANTPYRLWVRGRAEGNLTANDSAYVQFSDSVTSSGSAAWRIGSTSAARIILEPCNGCGIAGWGWEDNGWGTATTLGPEIRFATTGTKTLRIQSREDGFLIDQIVLSPERYRTTRPGSNRNDSTLLAPTIPPPPLTPAVTIVRFPYLQQVTDRSAVIVWATRESGEAEAVADGRRFAASSTRVSAARTGFSFDYYQHEATLTGLDPGTSYPYELWVGSARAASGSSIRTAPATGTVRFIAFGDSGIGSTAQKALAARMSSDTWEMAVHVGDIVYGATNTSGDASYKTYQWWFFDIYRDWLRGRGFFPSMGNHDGRSTNNYGQAYLDLFVLPEEAGASAYPDHAERYYSFDYGPIHFVALDTERAFQDPARRGVQLDWLRADLAATSKPWKVAYFHRSPYSAAGEHGSDLTVRQAFGPVFEQYGVQLALSGHEHMYERTVPWRESTDRARQAVTYIVTGGGGARLYPAGLAPWTAFSRSGYQYLRVAVNGCLMTTQSITTSGSVLDSFTLDRCDQASDAASPTVRVTSPSNGATVSGVVPLAATADDDVRVEKVDFWIDGVLRRIDRASPYTYSWDSRTAPAGTHRIEARAYDIDGNRTWSTMVTVTSTGS